MTSRCQERDHDWRWKNECRRDELVVSEPDDAGHQCDEPYQPARWDPLTTPLGRGGESATGHEDRQEHKSDDQQSSTNQQERRCHENRKALVDRYKGKTAQYKDHTHHPESDPSQPGLTLPCRKQQLCQQDRKGDTPYSVPAKDIFCPVPVHTEPAAIFPRYPIPG